MNLPLELRLQIWGLAIPEPQVLRIAFEHLPGGIRRAYHMGPIAIPTILHICRDSRAVACRIFRLGFGATTHPRDRDWWNPAADMLYLPGWLPPPHWDLRVTRGFLTEDDPPAADLNWDGWVHWNMWHSHRQSYAIAAVQHLALPWQEPFLEDFGVFEGEDWGLRAAGPPWLKGFPALKSVSFLVDHFPTWYRTGDILLYEPIDGSVFDAFGGESSADFEWRIEGALDDFKRRLEPEWDPPTVEILILGHGKTRRRSGFCLPSSSLPRPTR
jgi:hypothetical protein